MPETPFQGAAFDRRDPLSIFDHSRHLIGHTLRSLFGDEAVSRRRAGKGGLGQMVEELFFNYGINSSRDADFAEARVELKCTPLLRSKDGGKLRVKERLVCTMIDYFEIVDTEFEDSHLVAKCRLMLLLFYLHVGGRDFCDYEFLFRVLWSLPEKDLILIKNDYDTIAEKVRRGQAHLLSEGDTLYLGACRKGQKGDSLQSQPNSPVKARRRAFSLKPAYMRYILSHVEGSGTDHYTNYASAKAPGFELVSRSELRCRGFEQVILDRFEPFIGKDYIEICGLLGVEPLYSKNKYADVGALIASAGASRRLSTAEEFIKSGVTMKTVRLRADGMPKESMSFKNIDYCEVSDNDDWLESEAYELFTSRFLLVVFRPVAGREVAMLNRRKGVSVTEQCYVLDKAFFWTMPAADLEVAREYWENIREAVMTGHISADAFWSLADHKKFHVRPKARKSADKAVNPRGGYCDKYCYWLNADYIKTIIDEYSRQ
jgi:DNA mismatch repair protein MutH